MKVKGKLLAFLLVCVIILVQVPFTAFAADTTTDIRADLLSPDTLPDGRVEVSYSADFDYDYSKFNNGFNQYSWHIVDGELPPGLELKPDSGPTWAPWLQGTPTKAGTYTFTIRGAYTKLNGEFVIAAKKTYTLTILPAYPLQIANSVLYHGNENQSYSVTFEENHYRTVTWSMELADDGNLPEGLSMDTTGKLAWENPVAGKYNLKITASRDEESTSKVLRLIIEPGDGCTHTGAAKTERKHANCKENGLADYWYCDVCEQYFVDEECTRLTSQDSLDKLYTTAFHSDKDDDGKCDNCDKVMPVFQKVTNEDEITSCGMYLVVSKIGEKYYTFKSLNNLNSIDAVEITKNSDGTFSFPKSDTDVMILKTEFAAECGSLDAGQPRYSFGTTINGIPYSLSSEDYSGYIYMYSYENSKYGYRIKLTDEKYAEIASVYTQYWGGGKEESSSILTAFEGKKDGETKRFFSLRTKDAYESEGVYTGYGNKYFYDTDSLSTYPIELYKLTYTGSANGQSYFLSDGQSVVTINSEVTVIDNAGSNKSSTIGGISEAVKTSYVEEVISGQTEITGNVSATTYAEINLKSGTTAANQWGGTDISSLVYEITPKLKIKNETKALTKTIADENFDGSEITLTLCVGDMMPEQIIHHKTDASGNKTKEYFYKERSKGLKPGQKTFSIDYGYEKGNFVTFTVNSFSEIEILADAKSEKDNEVRYKNGALKITVEKAGNYTLILANYSDERMTAVKILSQTLEKGETTVTDFDGFTLTDKSKIFLWKNGETMEPVCEACDVAVE